MQLKKYHAQSIQEALKKIKSDLGDDAVIFDAKTINGQEREPKRLGRQMVEVTAAVERKSFAYKKQEQIHSQNNHCLSSLFAKKSNSTSGQTKDSLEYFYNDEPYDFSSNMPLGKEIFLPCFKNMLKSGINRDLAWYLLGEVSFEYKNSNNTRSLESILLKKIACHIPDVAPISVDPHKRKIITFIGPTGVGKTTTLAKIAAQFKNDKKVKIKIVTMDTYRIAAAEQIKIYGKIMSLPVIVAHNKQDIIREIESGDDTNLVLIDTAGRNYRDTSQIFELRSWLTNYENIEAHLLLGASTSEEILYATVKSFQKARVDRIIITKVDESIRQGHLYNIITSSNLPVSYITNGQKVPEDIMLPTTQTMASMVLNGYAH